MKRVTIIIFGILVASTSLIAQTKAQKLTVIVNNIESVEGSVSVVLYDTEESFLKKGIIATKEKVTSKGTIKLTFENIKPGSYTASVMHDQNANGALDKGMFGIPTEPYGFSNDATGSFGPPSFEDCIFEISDDKIIEITLN